MIETLAMAATMVAALVLLYRRDQRNAAVHRARAFENCRGVLSEAEIVRERGDYPMLRGRRGGHVVELRLLSENVNVRKLPVLWLLVTVRRPLPVDCAFDMLLRPQNTEFYSPHHRLEHRLSTPPDWPEHACIKASDRVAGYRLMERIGAYLAGFGGERRLKELFVGPGGVRLVWMVDEAVRSSYLTLRQAVYQRDVLDRELVEMLIERASAIGDGFCEVPNEQAARGGTSVPSVHGAGSRSAADGRRAGAERPALAGADDGVHGAGPGLGQLQPDHA